VIGVQVVAITKNKNILVCGCSFTYDSGFTPDNFKSYHYTSVLSGRYPINFNNIAIGGMSNREIALRTIENIALSLDHYDAVIVQWSSLSRWWYYTGQNNIDDFTGIVNGSAFGAGLATTDAKLLGKMLFTQFNNQYMLLKQWLLDCITLARLLENKVPYRFCLGFDNLLSEFNNVEYSDGFKNLSEELVDILDLQNRPDSYVLDKINVIKNLIAIVKQLNWINFPDKSWVERSVDLSDDRQHPGMKSNLLWADSLEPFISDLCLDK